MCGIAGIIDLKNRGINPAVIKKMTDALAHRGPNGEGIYVEKGLALGHRRLSILDVSAAGNQPMISDDGALVIVHNGEIYNYIELKKRLGGRPYRSGTDTEAILRAYERRGEKCLEDFNGIFAFALWDKKRKKLFAARDRLGVKPFYYAVYGGRFHFASEIKALLAAGVPAKPNDGVIYDYLTRGYYDHGEETFFDGIKQLMPGCALTIERGEMKIFRYWWLSDRVSDFSGKSASWASARFLEILSDAVRIQLRSDVPVGISVSGGLDSSLLAAVVNQVSGGQKNFQLFHFTYESGDYDREIPYVNLLAKSLGWEKPAVVCLRHRDVPELAEKVMRHEEQPFPGMPTFAWHKMYSEIGKTRTVVTLEGHGGDEIGAGYDYYAGAFLLDILKKYGMKRMTAELRLLAKVRGLSERKSPLFFVNGLVAYFRGGVSADASSFAAPNCLSDEFRRSGSSQPRFEESFRSFLDNFQYRDLLHTKLPRGLRSMDRESMAFGRELRVPLLDHRLVEFAFSLPVEQRIRGGSQRFFMREAAMKLLPKIISHSPKRSLPNPQRAWFQKELRPWIWSILSSRSFKSRKYFNQEKVLREYQNYIHQKNPANAFHIWQWLSVELWFRAFIDK